MAKTPAQLDRDITESVVVDAIIAGRMAEAKTMIKGSPARRLSKTQAKRVAKLLADEGRLEDATTVLAELAGMGKDNAARELAPAVMANVGDILVASYGYDQTNVDFYEVVSARVAMATIRKISKRVSTRGEYDNQVMPNPGSFVSGPKKVRVQKTGVGGYRVKVNDHHAYQWNGKPERETASGYGH
jgi:hypothetical protein